MCTILFPLAHEHTPHSTDPTSSRLLLHTNMPSRLPFFFHFCHYCFSLQCHALVTLSASVLTLCVTDDAVPPQLMRIDCDVVNRELLPIVNATNVIHP
eukprot:m.96532 g.96532  ORF g.96532 m.96532 type:complete len:98 (+) comp13075_c0_seq7:1975-2268(+)